MYDLDKHYDQTNDLVCVNHIKTGEQQTSGGESSLSKESWETSLCEVSIAYANNASQVNMRGEHEWELYEDWEYLQKFA